LQGRKAWCQRRKTETSQRKDLGPTEARGPLSRILPGLSLNLFFKLFRFFFSSKSFAQPLHAFPFRLTLYGFDKQLRFSRTVLLSRYAVFSDYSSLATRRFTLSLPLLFSISIPLVLSYVSLSSRSSNSNALSQLLPHAVFKETVRVGCSRAVRTYRVMTAAEQELNTTPCRFCP
jgi:hypothetical protein